MSKFEKHNRIEKPKYKEQPETQRYKKRQHKTTPKKSNHKHNWLWEDDEKFSSFNAKVLKRTCTICGKVIHCAKIEWK